MQTTTASLSPSPADAASPGCAPDRNIISFLTSVLCAADEVRRRRDARLSAESAWPPGEFVRMVNALLAADAQMVASPTA